MGYNSHESGRVVFDIETAPLAGAEDYIESAEAPGNYKDADKIAAYVADKNAEALSKCALDVDLCTVATIGIWSEYSEKVIVLRHPEEAELLKLFWEGIDGHHVVGFNCLAFDLPVLLRRSLYLGVPTPSIQIDRFKHPQVSDLMMMLSFNGALKFRGLSFYCKRFGINVPDPMTGADVALAVSEGRWDDVEAHVIADVTKTKLLASRLGLFTEMTTNACL